MNKTERLFEDPSYVYGFALMHVVMIFIVGLFMFPRFANFLIPEVRRGEGKYDVMPQYTIGETPVISDTGLEAGGSDVINGSSEVVTQEPKQAYDEPPKY